MISVNSEPGAGRVLRTLHDGYWDRMELIELPDGSRRVCKRTKGATAPGPWGVSSLQQEIRYLGALSAQDGGIFPPMLAAWEHSSADVPDVGYEMPYYAEHVDAGALARRGALPQREVDVFQDALAEVVLERLHVPAVAREPLSVHVVSAVRQALATVEANEAELAALIQAPLIELNGQCVPDPRAAFERIARDTDALRALDAPCVRLHGDFFLENILWRPGEVVAVSGDPRLILIDPVSVAGVTCGPPLFDLVKYVSYATGELLALRAEWVELTGFGAPAGSTAVPAYTYGVRWHDAALAPYRKVDWHTRFRRAFESKHGPVDRRSWHLIDGYFSVVMAANTRGAQRRARLLKATAEFAAVLA